MIAKYDWLGKGKKMSCFVLFLLLLLAIGGCSVVEYEKPISEFSTATDNAETALIVLNNQVTTAYTALQSKRVVEREIQPRFLTKSDSRFRDCQVESTRCQLEVVGKDKNPLGTFPPDPALRNMIILMTSIRVYAQNLTDIADADTSARVSASVNATLGSVASLADSVQKLEGAKKPVDLTEYTTPVGEVVNWLVGNYVAAAKLDGLRRATAEANPVIEEATRVIEASAKAGADVPKAALAEAVSMRNDAFAEERTAANLRLLIADAAAYDQFLLAKPEGVFARMKDAHQALASNLQTKNPSLGQVTEKTKSFLIEAQTLHRIIGSLVSTSTDKEQ